MDIKKKLTIPVGNSNEKVTIYVLDIIESEEFNKDFILYLIDVDDEHIYASQLNKKDNMYELNYITDEKELNFVKNKINEYKANV